MRPWIRLALKEFWLPFHYRKSRCPGGRDFAWLTIFMALILTLMLLLLASREGLLNRFVDVLLGNLPGLGVPISVTNNMLSKGGVNAIDTAVLAEINALAQRMPGLVAYPYHTLEASLHPLISLPAEKSWHNTQPDGSKFGPDFDGWAVAADDPLWRQTAAAEAFPLEIIVNRPLFRKHFDYAAYRQALQENLPPELFNTLPASIDPQQPNPFDKIWLQVTVGFTRELLPFRVTWVERFPVIDKIAYVFPLPTYYALKAAHDFPELRYFPEGQGKRTMRVKQLLLEQDQGQREEPRHDFAAQWGAQLGAEMSNYRGDVRLTLKQPRPKFWLDGYAKPGQARYAILEELRGDAIAYRDGQLLLPCGRLPDEYLRAARFEACTGDRGQLVALDVTARGGGYHHAIVYVPDRRFLALAKDALVNVKDHALSIHPSYQDALNRFGFLSEMLEALEKPYAWFLVIFLAALLGIQMGALIGHHRHRYGVLLSKGIEWWQIYAMLWLQILLAMLLGMFVAISGMTIASVSLQSAVRAVAGNYAETLGIVDSNLLPLSGRDYLLVAVTVFGLTLSLATVLLYCLPLRRRTHPALLL